MESIRLENPKGGVLNISVDQIYRDANREHIIISKVGADRLRDEVSEYAQYFELQTGDAADNESGVKMIRLTLKEKVIVTRLSITE